MKYLKNVATLSYNAEKCTGCGRCAEVCPRAVFAMDGKRAAVTDRDRCMECGACARNCAYGAISVSAGVGCAAAITNALITGGEPSCDCSSSSKGGCCG
ncbi:MAG TPA: mercury methylation ferredoxin HgcB [Spirochaetota bacterium]|nr:mercury methylation ferredoxin HgcB [Spirochaetota bacterium]